MFFLSDSDDHSGCKNSDLSEHDNNTNKNVILNY